ncbi:SIR2 family NAD-dependent protein deacylase [Xylocopilactobacillus apicola]|uniref:SIR2-like domain-containing protein n=1 Tax=Xylocopilactobacillus apicola TaxID=2932184 RepID=A0AAU9DCV7_9LACO|nr:SIR2 family protein [Xylocopilactobacillus apicola]BDR57630.1 hypothetical protein XA3_00710 [Xylocopilactobacillus apicola]
MSKEISSEISSEMNSEFVLNREEVIGKICERSQQGMLGLFLGSGFSKAVVGDRALSWAELLKQSVERLNRSCDKLDIKLDLEDDLLNSGLTYPLVASRINKAANKALNEANEIIQQSNKQKNQQDEDYVRASDFQFKEIIANVVSVYPKNNEEKKWKDVLIKTDCSWILTTNYDHIAECLLNGRALSIYPNNIFSQPKGLVPVFHLHGSIWNPESIVITNEDYAKMLRPGDYRQTRLPFLLKEYTILMVGYDLGDLNVLSAVDWNRTVKVDSSVGYEQDVYFIRYKGEDEKVVDNPYKDPETGITIIETNDVHSIFSEIVNQNHLLKKKYSKSESDVKKLTQKFVEAENSPDKEYSDSSIEDVKDDAKKVLELAPLYPYLLSNFFIYIKAVIDNIYKQARKPNAFDKYDIEIQMILMLMNVVEEMQMPDTYVSLLCTALNNVAEFFGDHSELGKAWKATDTWNNGKRGIPDKLKERMKKYCDNSSNKLLYARKVLE